MRVVHIYNWLDPQVGGPPRVIAALAAAQRDLGCEIQLISSDKPQAEAVDAFLAQYLSPLPPRLCVRPKFFKPILNRRKLRRGLAGADLVHLHGIWPPVCLLASQICRQLRIPYLLAPHGSLHHGAMRERPLRKLTGLFLLGYREMIQGAAAIHALNPEEQDRVAWVRLPERVEVIPNGIFPDAFERRPAPNTFRRSLPKLGEAPYLLFLSRLHPGKGLELLGGAFSSLAAEFSKLHLVIAGPDQGGRRLLEAELSRGLEQRVHFTGNLEGARKDAAFCEARGFCLPSHHEGFSVAISEALAWGCPVVISEGCHFPRVGTARAGLICAGDTKALTQSLRQLLSDPEEAAAMGRRGQALIRENYTWPAIAAQSLKLYEEIIQNL